MSTFSQQSADPLYPLDAFYAASGLPAPTFNMIDGEDVPQPYRKLLVHDDDMTPTLESFHGQTLHLRVLSKREENGTLFREVALVRDDDERPVEFGAIRIDLDLFPDDARQVIRECRVPLGTIMARFKVAHKAHPSAYLSVSPDDTIRDALGLPAEADLCLYGRHNVHVSPAGEPMAHVVEILPPVDDES